MSVAEDLAQRRETVWINPEKECIHERQKVNGFGFVYVQEAQNRFMRFLPYIAEAFPETAAKKGVIESPLLPIPEMKAYLNERGAGLKGSLYLKDDAHLPIAGSVKARGGINAVLKIAERLALKEKHLRPDEDYRIFASEEYKKLFGEYTIQVGSTGNLALSIGRMSAKLGFRAIVHMSRDAKEWKKELLRSEGVVVKEYDGDYGTAVANGRRESQGDPKCFFIDDENSQDLFFGYSSAAVRLKVQLYKAGIEVNREHPLFVYLPCGVGGAPGGIAFGLKQVFGENVHCFTAEPVEAPCMILGLSSGRLSGISVYDIGLSGKTEADGLAVGRASEFASAMMKPILSGAATVSDEYLLEMQRVLYEKEGIFAEPSACAGFSCVRSICLPGTPWEEYLIDHDCIDYMDSACHIVWSTGGGLLEKELRKQGLLKEMLDINGGPH